jgi:broad-specificity NMP kinase
MVCDELEPLMSGDGGIILEFHSCDFFPERWFQLVVLLRCNNMHLFDRLQQRGYDQRKIDENIDCEIMDVLHDEVYESYKEDIIMELQSNEVQDM